jgi:glutamate racemase
MIGVFDSGSGGLTVLQALRDALPDRDFIYLGDHRHAPYGVRTEGEINALTRFGVDHLFDLGCGLVIIACNTAAAVALRPLQRGWLQTTWPDRRVLGVLAPMVETITGVPWSGTPGRRRKGPPPRTVGVFATTRSVLTCAWRREIRARAPGVAVVQQQCPGLSTLIERGAPSADIDAAVGRFSAGLLGRLDTAPDAVVLGCTHCGLIADRFAAALPATSRILDQPGTVARSLADYLDRHPQTDADDGSGRVHFYTTGDSGAASGLATRFLSAPVTFFPIGGESGADRPEPQLISAGGAA